MLANNLNLLKKNCFLSARRLTGVHVGFHYGEEISKYIDLDCKTVICFEPLKDCYDIARDNLKRITKSRPHSTYFVLRNIGCGDTCGQSQMYTFDGFSSGLSSIKEPLLHSLESHFGSDPRHDLSTLSRSMVFIDTLDNQLATIGGKIDFLVIDTQGYELEVLRGASQTLKRTSLLEIEITRLSGSHAIYKDSDNYNDIMQILSDQNFIPISPLSVAHASVLFAKNN